MPIHLSVNSPEHSNEYEVAAVAVKYTFQKQGLAAHLLRMIEDEVAQKTKQEGNDCFKLLVRTGKEITESYWTKKGFVTRNELYFKPGVFGSETGFSILEMYQGYVV